MLHILKCSKCSKYSLKEKCCCGGKALGVAPVKYSPEDRFAKYRRKAKEDLK